MTDSVGLRVGEVAKGFPLDQRKREGLIRKAVGKESVKLKLRVINAVRITNKLHTPKTAFDSKAGITPELQEQTLEAWQGLDSDSERLRALNRILINRLLVVRPRTNEIGLPIHPLEAEVEDMVKRAELGIPPSTPIFPKTGRALLSRS